jgi:hypothetical protein
MAPYFVVFTAKLTRKKKSTKGGGRSAHKQGAEWIILGLVFRGKISFFEDGYGF